MAIVPLIKNVSIVDSQAQFEGGGSTSGPYVLIQNLDPDQLAGGGDSNITYDLRVGREYFDHRDLNRRELGDDGVLELLPGMAVIIETEEVVAFPAWAFGAIVPRVSLLQQGVSNTTSKVDPGYRGNLLISVFNLGKRTVRLRRREAFCSVYILRVEDGCAPYDKPAKRLSAHPASSWTRAVNFIEGHVGLIQAIHFAVTALIGAATVALLYLAK